MLRYHMAVITRDPALKRSVKRLTTATGSTADFVVDAASLATDRDIHLLIYDARQHAPPPSLLANLSRDAKVVYIIQGDSLVRQLDLLADERVTSLFCHDERFDDDEFIATCTKALRGEVFGLQKHFPWGVTTFAVTARNHEEKGRAIELLVEYATAAGCRGSVRDRIQLVCDELMMNALYHAPVDPQGNELYAGRPVKELAQLAEVNPVRIQYGCSGRYFGVSVRDGGGSLRRTRLLEYLLRARAGAQIEDRANGAGLGLVSVLKSVSKLIFHVDPTHATEVIALFDMELFAKGKMGARSLHVFQVPPHAAEEEAAAPARAASPTRRALWVVTALLFAVAAAFSGALYVKRTRAAAPAAAAPPGGPAARERTVTIYPEPADATISLNGRAIQAGVAIPFPAGERATLSIERRGYVPRTLDLPNDEMDRDRLIQVMLAPRAPR